MTWPGVALADVGLIMLYAGLLWVPGAVVGLAVGLRGWLLAAAAPLFSYAVVGLAGPWYAGLGVRWSVATFGLAVLVATAGCAAVSAVARGSVRNLLRRRDPPGAGWQPAPWHPVQQAGVAFAVLAGALVGAVSILGGIHALTTIPQDWDGAFHANGIRWIVDTGDGGLYAMGQINWFEGGVKIFYPNAYHLLAALVVELTGRDIPSVLNAQTVLIPALLALTSAALVRRFGGRAVFAGATAVLVATVSAVYDLLWRGPLLPFATGAVLTPVIVILVADLLDASGWRRTLPAAVAVALGAAGLTCLHTAMLFGAVIYILPMLAQRWLQRPSRLRTEPLLLLGTAVVCAVPLSMQLAGAVASAGLGDIDWPVEVRYPVALGQAFTFGHGIPAPPQWLLAAALLIGALRYHRLGELRWIGATALIFTALFVAAASLAAPWAHALTRPWWDDAWRLIAVAAVPLAIIAAHGVAEVQRLLAAGLAALGARLRRGGRLAPLGSASLAAAVASGLVAVGVVLGSDGLYVQRNEVRMAINTDQGIAVNAREIEAMRVLAQIVPPESKVLNDRGDGSVWMYAIADVRPVAGHYDGSLTGADAALLAQRFNRYDRDPAVRAAAARLNVGYVLLGTGFLRPGTSREPGLTDLDNRPWLQKVYDNGGAAIYHIVDSAAGGARNPAMAQLGGPG